MIQRMDPQRILPVKQPLEVCSYCWYLLHPGQAYPESWSSSCCDEHSAWQQARVAVARGRACWLQATRPATSSAVV